MVVLISYDLNGNERPSAYEDAREVIESHAKDTIRPLYSQWFAETDDSVETWTGWLKEVTDNNDRLFIIEVRRPYQGLLTKDDWAWLSSRM